MTKKDYISIAKALKDIPRTSGRVELIDVVKVLASVFKLDNDKFDPLRFKDAVFGNFAGMRGLK